MGPSRHRKKSDTGFRAITATSLSVPTRPLQVVAHPLIQTVHLHRKEDGSRKQSIVTKSGDRFPELEAPLTDEFPPIFDTFFDNDERDEEDGDGSDDSDEKEETRTTAAANDRMSCCAIISFPY